MLGCIKRQVNEGRLPASQRRHGILWRDLFRWVHAVKCRSSCLQASIAVSSDNSAAAGARTSRKCGPGSSWGLLGSDWVETWVHPEGQSEL